MARDHHSTKRGKPHVHMKLVMHTSLILHDHGGDRTHRFGLCSLSLRDAPNSIFEF